MQNTQIIKLDIALNFLLRSNLFLTHIPLKNTPNTFAQYNHGFVLIKPPWIPSQNETNQKTIKISLHCQKGKKFQENISQTLNHLMFVQ
jgi:hypothetical protein